MERAMRVDRTADTLVLYGQAFIYRMTSNSPLSTIPTRPSLDALGSLENHHNTPPRFLGRLRHLHSDVNIDLGHTTSRATRLRREDPTFFYRKRPDQHAHLRTASLSNAVNVMLS